MPSVRIIIIVLFFGAISLHAQKYELGKVSLSELEQKKYPIDTSASAAILYNKARTYFLYDIKKGFSLVNECEFRIKIYKIEGLNWANFKVPYCVGYQSLDKDQVAFFNAVTYNLENGKIAKTKVGNEGKFKKEINEFWNEAVITMPNVKIGSIVEFKYVQTTDVIAEFPDFRFQYEIPVAFSEYTTEIPQFFIYRPIKTGSGYLKTDAEIANGFQNYKNEYNQTLTLNYQQINTKYTVYSTPALKEEPYVDNIENYRFALKHELTKKVFPDVPEKNYAESWESVAATIYKDERFGKELLKRSYIDPFIAQAIGSAVTDMEKVTAIFDFVKRTMNWNGFYGYLTKKGVEKAFSEQTGNSAEINFIVIAMLNRAGLFANPVLISTVNNGIPAFPNRTVFNFVIAAVTIDGKQILLDATDKNSAPNILPLRDLNWTGRLIKTDASSEEIKLAPKDLSKETINITAKIAENGNASGKIRYVRTDHEGLYFRNKHGNENQSQYIENLENKYPGLKVSEYSSDLDNNTAKSIAESFNFTSENVSEIIDGKIYFNPLLFYSKEKNPFVLEERQLPIYYGYPFQLKHNVSFEIPAGYSIESLPKPIKVSTGTESFGTFTFNISSADNKIQIVAVQEINSALISNRSYDALKDFYKKMIDKQNEKIILKKL